MASIHTDIQMRSAHGRPWGGAPTARRTNRSKSKYRLISKVPAPLPLISSASAECTRWRWPLCLIANRTKHFHYTHNRNLQLIPKLLHFCAWQGTQSLGCAKRRQFVRQQSMRWTSSADWGARSDWVCTLQLLFVLLLLLFVAHMATFDEVICIPWVSAILRSQRTMLSASSCSHTHTTLLCCVCVRVFVGPTKPDRRRLLRCRPCRCHLYE